MIRSFSLNSKGAIVKKGDFIRQKSRSNNSVASTASSVTQSGTNTSCATSGGQSRGPTSKVQILGAPDVGKTTIINQFMTSEYMNAYETQGKLRIQMKCLKRNKFIYICSGNQIKDMLKLSLVRLFYY